MAKTAERKLTKKQAQFAQEYLVDLNATQAAMRAGYSPKTARQLGNRLLATPHVAREIERRRSERMERTEITSDVVLMELLRLARADISMAFDENGTLKPLHEIPEDVRRAIAGVDVDELFEGRGKDREMIGYVKKIKFWDKTKALELLGKHLNLFTEKVHFSGDLTVEVVQFAGQDS